VLNIKMYDILIKCLTTIESTSLYYRYKWKSE